MTEVLYCRSDELTDLATPAEYVTAVRDGYRQQGLAEPRTTLRSTKLGGMLTTYIAILPDTGVMGGYQYAAGFGASDVHFLLPLFDTDSGAPLALLDGASMNPFKTGAAGAVGVDALARADATELAVIGSGAQARGQVRATMTVRSFETVRVYSPTPAHREAFADEMDTAFDADVRAVTSSAAAVEAADVVITATRASDPVIDDANLADGAHVTAMGQYHPEKNELPPETIARATYVPDLRARATSDAGSFLAAMAAGLVEEDHIHGDLGAILAGDVPGRTRADEVTVFDSGGTAIETVAAGSMLYEKAKAAGRGKSIDIAPGSEALTG